MPDTGFAGRRIALTWDGEEIAGVREKGIQLNGEPIDITSDDDDGWRKLLEEDVSENQVDISVSGVVKSTTLKEAWFGGTRVQTATITYPDGGVISGSFMLASYSETGNYKDATTFEGALQSTGTVTYTPPSP